MTRAHWFLLAALLLLNLSLPLLAQEQNQAALVIGLQDGRVITRCVVFDEEEITGYDLLHRSGLSLAAGVGGLGAAVCQIEGTGCPANDCFCHCRGGGPCEYWSYWRLVDGDWQYSRAGAGIVMVGHGAVEGWSWGPGSPDAAPPPPLLSFDDVCSPAAATAPADTAPTIMPGVPAADSTAVPHSSWAPYALFGLIIVGLGLAFVLARRRRGGV